MISNAHPHSANNSDLFRQKVVVALRQAGRLQRELAHAMGINPQVLSRKLHKTKQAFLSHTDVKQIIKILAAWDAIEIQAEAIELLSYMGLKAESFSEQEWNTAPLKRLEVIAHDNTPTATSSPPLAPIASLSSLPAPSTELLGRAHDIQMLLDRLRQSSIRLLTLLGTGGVGKTRLALAIAHIAHNDFADGVFFVPLATLSNVTLVPSTIMQVLHLKNPVTGEEPGRQTIFSQEEALKTFLRDKKILLILDNVEQIPAIAPFIGDLLSSTPALKIMVTSRAVLHLYGEQEFIVPSLDFSIPNQATDLHTVSQLSAIRLFIERAQAINPSFQITEQNAAIITHICARLDGLPLAIELAAARTKVLSLPMILQRLTGETGLTFLQSKARDIPQRHQTLQVTLNWSYELLTSQQQRFFRHLSVFVGGWTAQAALIICMAEDKTATLDDVLELIEALIDQSLVKRAQSGMEGENLEPHFYFLTTIHEYALGCMVNNAEMEEIQRRHATYYLALVETFESDLTDQNQAAAAARLIDEQDNLRAALTWSIDHDETEITQRMCGTLGKFWEARAQFQEAHLWIDTALKITRETAPAIRAKLLLAASRIVLWEMACERSRELAQEALTLYEANEDIAGKAYAIFQIGDTWHMQGEYTQATRYIEESVHLFRIQKIWGTYAFALSRLGAIALLQGNFSQAWVHLQEALPLLRTYSEPNLLNVALVYLGTLALIQGDVEQSILYLREGLLLARKIENHYTLATTLITLGCLLGATQEPSYAARICSAAEALFASLNTTLPAAYQPLYNAYLGGIKAQIDEMLWQIWWTEGQTLSQEEVSKLVLEAM